MRLWLTLPALVGLLTLTTTGPAQDAKQPPALKLRLRTQAAVADKGTPVKEAVRFHDETWPANQTAIIVCDVWDAHHCLNAVHRLEELVPVMNRVLEKVRDQGVLIIHAPSDCMAAYKDHPGRKRAE